ncbi:MAG: lipid A biosynthesis acyltransferase [Chitinophagales bacterium]|nr:MAG: lipid A biosynthesis acyltransferase [Chitinophagales bacterium]
MSTWEGKSRGNKLGYAIFVAILRHLGVKPAYLLLRFIAFYYFITLYQSSANLYYLYRHRLKFSRVKALLGIYKNYYRLGQNIIDKVVVMSGLPHTFTFDFDGEEHLAEMVRRGTGGILISGHIGNWEIPGHFLNKFNVPINIVMYDAEREQIKEYLDEITGGRTVKVIAIKNDLSHIFQISQALNQGELVCMHADRFMPGNRTLLLDFLGKPAPFPLGPFLIASSLGAPVSYVFGIKETDRHYHLFGSPLKFFPKTKDEAQLRSIMQEYVQALEQKVKQYPYHWFNYHNFWANP